MALTADQVQKFYIGYYARPADPVGLTYWQTQDEAAALKGFSGSDEFTKQFTGLSASQQVTKVYNNLLGRAPDAAGLLYWAGELTAGRETIGTLVLSMTKNALGKDVTTIEDRVSYSKSFTAALDTPAEINAYAGTVATQTARDALLKVVANSVGDHTALNAEVKNINTTISTIVSGGGVSAPSATFTLTANNDYADTNGFFLAGGNFSNAGFKFTAANETVNASNTTLTAGDILVDASTNDNDVLNVALAGNPGAATIQNIETINFTAMAPANVSLANVSGLKTITVTGAPAGAIAFTNIGTGTGVTTIDASTVSTNAGGVTASFAASTSTAALTLKGGAGADVFISGLGNDTVSGGAGADRLITGAGDDTVSGDGGADIIDAGSGNDVITGGAGNDILIAGDGADKITGGAGNDEIVLGSVAGRVFAPADTILLADGTTVSPALEAGDTTAYANGQMSFNNLDDGELPNDFAARNIVAGDFAVQAGSAVSALAVTAAGSNTVVFEADAAANGSDNIYGFNTGAVAAGGDILDFSAFLGTAAKVVVYNGGDANADNLTAYNVVVNNNPLATDALTYAANTKYVIIQEGATNTTISYMTTDGAGAAGAATVVATLVGVNNIDGFLATQAI